MVFNLDTLSISTHAKTQDMADSHEIVSDLMPLINDPEALSRAVKEASIRGDVSTVENVLMPIVNKTNELSAKVIELAGQYEAGNYGDIKVRAMASLDKTVERLDRQYQSIRSTDPEALAETIEGLITINATLLLQILHFLVLLFILNRLLFRPILKVVKERDSYIEERQAGIEKVRLEVEELKARFVHMENDVRQSAAKESTKYREAGLSEAERLLAKSRERVASIKSEADEAVKEEIDEAKAELGDMASSLADEIMEKIVGRRVIV
jgi:F0F1-type ATP synthase membrane subunit b/b'